MSFHHDQVNRMRYGVSFVAMMLQASIAAAEVPGPRVGVVPPIVADAPEIEPSEEPAFAPRLDQNVGWGGAFQAYTGIATHRGADAFWSHGVLGGTVRARYGYLTVGGFYEVSDWVERGRWTSQGGFAGVHLPFASWVDVDAVIGGGVRTHEEDDLRYGPDGYSWSTPALCFRLMLSDRSGESVGAVRVGAELFASFDLKRAEQTWRYEFARRAGAEPRVITGETPVGGSSIGIAVTIGIDFAQSKQRSSRARITG